VGVAREREERYGKKHRMVGVDTIGGRPKVGGVSPLGVAKRVTGTRPD
jgi:hypothetical protein